ncbi:hypothetical protein ACHAWF_006079 [Thalassiosira exigua]
MTCVQVYVADDSIICTKMTARRPLPNLAAAAAIVAVVGAVPPSSAFATPGSPGGEEVGRARGRGGRRLRLRASSDDDDARRRAACEARDDDDPSSLLLVPRPNPHSEVLSNPAAVSSLSGVPFSSVLGGIDALYPPDEYPDRNARSRADGYWKYVERGATPPKEFAYGEFDAEFFGTLLDRAWGHYHEGRNEEDREEGSEPTAEDCDLPWTGKTFCDVGSGTGRLVVAASALHPRWKVCRGVEILPRLHDAATSVLERCRGDDDGDDSGDDELSDDSRGLFLRVPPGEPADSIEGAAEGTIEANEADPSDGRLPMAPIEFACASFSDPYLRLDDVDCAFVFSSCMSPAILRELSVSLARQLRPGSIVVTTEFPLELNGTGPPSEDDARGDAEGGADGDLASPHGPYELELLEAVDGYCWPTGGTSTAYLHRVKASPSTGWEPRRTRPTPTLEEEARRLVRRMEEGTLTDPADFVRRVRNDMIFEGVASEFLPDAE